MTMTDKTLVFLDVETTGLSPEGGDRVIEIAALKVRGLKPAGEFQSLINPGRAVSWSAYMVNHISDAMLEGEPPAREVLPAFLEFIEGAELVGHNVKFDIKFLNYELKLAELKGLDDYKVYDTVKMARGLLPELKRYSLSTLVYHFGINNPQAHRAAADTYATYELFCRLYELMKERELHANTSAMALFNIAKFPKMNKKSKLKILGDAITAGEAVNMLYQGAASGWTHRRINPMKVLGTGKKAQVEGYCHLRRETRSFSIERIATIEIFKSENAHVDSKA